MGERWMLNRAGIVNVYQYADEVLRFGGGRLLLRGVNGSGKSTAMNMLLPFLLDGDTRKIDAAGEQSGVLKSWMLSGRDDAQPIGYLWIEFDCGGEYVTCGCGIRANRSSDTVTTWWWITPRRPGIDLDLVQDGRPLSAEGLRAVIGPDSVYRQEDRRLYREEVRRRMYGGADIDQHIRLLHIVRSPRVGDRIDQDLPSYLHDALPQLSEAALSDAAQPLDDLEEHRHNVAELGRTSTALRAIHDVYASYCRSELRRRADRAQELVEAAVRSRRAMAVATTTLRQAEAALQAAGERVRGLDIRMSELRADIASLRDLPAYKEGTQLEDLRTHVKSEANRIERAQRELDRRRAQEEDFRQQAINAARASYEDHHQLGSALRELGNETVTAGLPVVAPDLPEIVARPAEGGLADPDPFPADTVRARLSEVRGAAEHRRGDLADVRGEMKSVASATARLESAGRDLDVAEDELEGLRSALDLRTSELDEATSEWRDALRRWSDELARDYLASGLAPMAAVDLQSRLIDRRPEVLTALRAGADSLVAHWERATATAEAQVEVRGGEVERAAAHLAELESMALPEPPVQPWQRASHGPMLAELVDYVDGLDESVRASIEAAMEAGGLLTAEVMPDGGLALEEGLLVSLPQARVAEPLSRYLVPTEGSDPVVARVLGSISTDHSDLQRDGVTVVTSDGRFRVGALAGRHAKDQAEHVGLSARRDRLERLRSEARARLAEAQEVLTQLEGVRDSARRGRASAAALRDRLPSDEKLAVAIVARQGAVESAGAAEARVADRRSTVELAEEAHSEVLDKCRRVAANLGLIADDDALDEVSKAIAAADRAIVVAEHGVTVLLRSLSLWRDCLARWLESRGVVADGVSEVAEHTAQLRLLRARLQTLEETFGSAFEEIRTRIQTCEAEAESSQKALAGAQQTQLEANAAQARATAELDQRTREARDEEQRALGAIPLLKRALAVPGLAASIAGDATWAAAPVEESLDGLHTLVTSIRSHLPIADGRDVTADGVRQSLRQRRDSLGAGWDAEDRQPDETVPLTIEINGPEGRHPLAAAVAVVDQRLSELSSLLSSEQDSALRNLLQGLVAREVAEKLHAAEDLVARMNRRLNSISTAHGIGVSIRWKKRDDLDPERNAVVTLLAKRPDLRTEDEDARLREILSTQLDYARRESPDASYSELIGRLLDYTSWYEIVLLLRRPGRSDERLSRRTPLSEGEKKIVSYLPLFAAVAASCDSLADSAPNAPRFLLLDDAFAKVSEDNHPKLFGLLVELDLDFIATSERLWGTYVTVPQLAITEVIRDAGLGVVVLEHSRWDGVARVAVP